MFVWYLSDCMPQVNFKHLLTHPPPLNGSTPCAGPCWRPRGVHIKSFYWGSTRSSHHWAFHHKNINHRLCVEYLMERQYSTAGLGNQKGTCSANAAEGPKEACVLSKSQGGSPSSVIYNVSGLTVSLVPSTNPKPLTVPDVQTSTNYGLNDAEELLQIAGIVCLCPHYLVGF